MIDFHCHLDLYPKPKEIVDGCRSRNVIVLSVTTTPRAWHGTLALGEDNPLVHTALGLHPELAYARRDELDLFKQHLPLTQYVGEIGLDGSPELKGTWQAQCEVFDNILMACATAGGRVLSIHSRRAVSSVLTALANQPDSGCAILHWFSGTQQELSRAIDIGCWFSVGPSMLMSKKGRLLVASMPRDRIVTETDGPFAQIENRAALPWDASQAVQAISASWGMPLSEVSATLYQNVQRLLARDREPTSG